MGAKNSPSSPKVLGIAGSPRRKGNTDLLLAQALKGAASDGADTSTIIACDLDIAPCRHCGGCLKTGRCVIKDDMQDVHRQLRDADHIILASPVFFMGVTAQCKALIDRCQALWSLKYVLKKPVAIAAGKKRKGLFISVGGLPYERERLFGPSRATARAFFSVLEVKYSMELFYHSVDVKGDISRHPTALAEAYEAGRELVSAQAQE